MAFTGRQLLDCVLKSFDDASQVDKFVKLTNLSTLQGAASGFVEAAAGNMHHYSPAKYISGPSNYQGITKYSPLPSPSKPETRNSKPGTRTRNKLPGHYQVWSKTLSPELEPRNPKPETRIPKLETRHPTPDTRNPKTENRNSKPETRTRNRTLHTSLCPKHCILT